MLKKLRINIIKNLAQIYANVLVQKMEKELSQNNKDSFFMTFEQAAKLNFYCIVFHEIYLD